MGHLGLPIIPGRESNKHRQTLGSSNVAIENPPFLGDFLDKRSLKPLVLLDFPLPCLITRGYETIRHAAFIDLFGVQAVVWICLDQLANRTWVHSTRSDMTMAFATMLLVPYMACRGFR